VLVFEADLFRLWCLAACAAHLDFTLVEPSLVDGRALDVVRFGHSVVEFELLHEAVVGLAEGPGLADLGEGLARCDAVSLHEKGAGYCCGAGFPHGTRGVVSFRGLQYLAGTSSREIAKFVNEMRSQIMAKDQHGKINI